MLMHKEAHRPKTVRPAMSPARQQFHDRLKQRFKLQREADAVALRAIVDEHTRNSDLDTMLAMAATIKELRDNLRRLKLAIDDTLSGEGFVGLQRYGPYREQHLETRIQLARKRS
jgi:hypothetical protein